MAKQKHESQMREALLLKQGRSMIRLRKSIEGDVEINDRLIPFVASLWQFSDIGMYSIDLEAFHTGDFETPMVYFGTEAQAAAATERTGIAAGVSEEVKASEEASTAAFKKKTAAERKEYLAEREADARYAEVHEIWENLSADDREAALASLNGAGKKKPTTKKARAS